MPGAYNNKFKIEYEYTETHWDIEIVEAVDYDEALEKFRGKLEYLKNVKIKAVEDLGEAHEQQ